MFRASFARVERSLSPNDPIRLEKHLAGDDDAELVRSLEIDDELESPHRLDRQTCGIGAPDDLIDQPRRLPPRRIPGAAITGKAAARQ